MGLMLELLGLPSRLESPQGPGEYLLDIEKLVVLAGIDQLRGLASKAAVFPADLQDDARMRSFEHYSALAQRAAGIAERLAINDGSAPPEDAYAAGLVRNLGALPNILAWHVPELHRVDRSKIGAAIAKSWGLPQVLIDVVRGDLEACPASSRVLLHLANMANAHALALEAELSVSRP